MSFSELYLIYYPKLVRFAKEFVMSEEDAENITQDVFTDLWENRRCLKIEKSCFCIWKKRKIKFDCTG